MINDIFNFLIDNRDKLSLVDNDAHSFEDINLFTYETEDSKIMITTDKHIRPISINIVRK